MMPMAIFEIITGDTTLNDLGITEDRVFELQSINQDVTPDTTTYLVIIDMQESTISSATYGGMGNGIHKAPRVMEISVHISWNVTRDYHVIDRILNRIDKLFYDTIQYTGTDGVRITSIRKQGRTRNLQDDGWQTTTRHATYTVLYDELAA